MIKMAKISEEEKVEVDNLIDEASEIFESCVRCGMCEKLCFSRWSVASFVGGRSLRLLDARGFCYGR